MLNLDFSLETIGERIDFLNDLLDSDQTFTHKELEKMGEYLLYVYDKQIITKDSRKKAHERVIKDKANGKKTYVIIKKNAIVPIYDENKQQKIKNNAKNLAIIEENQNDLKKLKEFIRERDFFYFHVKGISKNKLLNDINSDISDLEKAKSLFNVYGHGGEFNKHDKIDLNYIDYTDETFIYEVLKNMQYIEMQSPPSNLFFICMDFIEATKNIKFTKKQQEVLYKLKYGESIREEISTVQNIIKKYSNYFKKNSNN
jgi:hypothetical protein